MSDLISRSKLIDYFYYGIDDKPIIDGISDRKIIDIIKNQPTAYSVEQIAECLEELKFLRQWKSDVMDEFCKYDCNSVGEAIHNGYIKAIDDFVKAIVDRGLSANDDKYYITHYDNYLKVIKELAEQLKAGGENEQSI